MKKDTKLHIEAFHAGYQAGYENGKRDALKWISVKERLPETPDEVVITSTVDGSPEPHIGRYNFQHWWDAYGMIPDGEVTHWCVLPEPPEVEG